MRLTSPSFFIGHYGTAQALLKEGVYELALGVAAEIGEKCTLAPLCISLMYPPRTSGEVMLIP